MAASPGDRGCTAGWARGALGSLEEHLPQCRPGSRASVSPAGECCPADHTPCPHPTTTDTQKTGESQKGQGLCSNLLIQSGSAKRRGEGLSVGSRNGGPVGRAVNRLQCQEMGLWPALCLWTKGPARHAKCAELALWSPELSVC